jgi:hypothetical protein
MKGALVAMDVSWMRTDERIKGLELRIKDLNSYFLILYSHQRSPLG